MADPAARSAFEARVAKLADELMAAQGRPAQIRAAVPARPDVRRQHRPFWPLLSLCRRHRR
eukprot:scaffold16783_cov118-Isochrysis_galbana.AAC.2